jgi:hypothetical protein
MRRRISIAAFALLLTVPVWAQRGGGGHAGGGGMRGGGFVSRGGGHIGGGHSFSGMRSGGMRSGRGFSRGFSHASNRGFNSFNRGSTHGSSQNHGSHHGHGHHSFNHSGFHNNHSGFHNNCFGFSCGTWGVNWGWGWGWGGYYDPWLWSTWDDQDRRFDEDYYRQYELAYEWNRQNLEEQRMRRDQEEAEADQDAYAPRYSNRSPASGSASQPPDPVPATVLVYRDQHRQEVQNYAIVEQTLWAYSTGRTQKIPFADLDVAATEKANDERGVTFRAPTVNQGQ